jgi:hypothetical protein
MIFFKSIAEIKKNQHDLKEKMNPKNLKNVKSKMNFGSARKRSTVDESKITEKG